MEHSGLNKGQVVLYSVLFNRDIISSNVFCTISCIISAGNSEKVDKNWHHGMKQKHNFYMLLFRSTFFGDHSCQWSWRQIRGPNECQKSSRKGLKVGSCHYFRS